MSYALWLFATSWVGFVASDPVVQTFIREPTDVSFEVNTHAILPCQVQNKRGTLQWTKDGFGLGVDRNLTGFDRYKMVGSDEEGKRSLSNFRAIT